MDETQEKPRKTALLHYSIFVCCAGCSLLYGYNIGILNATWKLHRAVASAEQHIRTNNETLLENKPAGTTVQTPLEKESKNQHTVLIGDIPFEYVFYVGMGSVYAWMIFNETCWKTAFLMFLPAHICLTTICAVVMSVFAHGVDVFGHINWVINALHDGASTSIAYLYITDIVPKRDRLFADKCQQTSFAIGFLVSTILLSMQHIGYWYQIFVFFGFNVVVTLAFCVSFLFCPESPRHLLEKEDDNQAEKVLRKLGIDDAKGELQGIREEMEKSPFPECFLFKQLMISPELRKSMIAAIISEILHHCAGPSVWVKKVSSFKMKWCMEAAATLLLFCLLLHKPKEEITSVISVLALLLYMLFYPTAFGLGTASRTMTDNFPEIICRQVKIFANFAVVYFNAQFLRYFPCLENFLGSYTYFIFAVAILVSIITTWFINPKNTGQDESIRIDGSLERLREENESLREVVMCKLCKAKPKSILYNKCCHCEYCSSCDISENPKNCPKCQEPIKSFTHVTLSPNSLQDMADIDV